MTHAAPDPTHAEGSIFDGLLGADAADHWAFGTDFEDPLAGVDTTVPEGVDPSTLADYCLGLADDALVMSHRLSEWCSRAPDLEDDIAVANIALDLLGQARLLLARAAAADPGVVPELPEDSPVPPEDALAFFRDAHEFRNVALVEVPHGDFAHLVLRILLFATPRLALLQRLRESRDPVLSAVAAKGVKEVAYHRDYGARWVLTLAQGTEESRRRLTAAVAQLWPLQHELTTSDDVATRASAEGVGVDPATLRSEVATVLDQVLAAAGMERPDLAPPAAVAGRRGRDGVHTEALSRLLAEMQVVARAHPRGQW